MNGTDNPLLKRRQVVEAADAEMREHIDMLRRALVIARVTSAEHYATAVVSVSTKTLSMAPVLPLGNTKVSEQERFW